MFASVPHPRNFGAALRDIAHHKPEVRASAARDLRHHADDHRDQTIEALVRAVSDESPMVRAAAAETLTDVRGGEALPALIDCIRDDADVDVRQMALMAVGAIGDERACSAVENALRDPAPPIRFQAVIAFARCADRKRATQAILRATRDEDALVCHIALRMAEELGDDDTPADAAIVNRCRELYDHESPIVRIAAAIIRARAGEDDANALLLAVVDGSLVTDQAEDEAAAIELCGELGIAQAAAPLARRAFAPRLIRGGDRFAWQARVALAQLGDERAIRWIMSELKAWTRERRTLAVAAAGRAQLAIARPLLMAMKSDASRADPDVVADALAAIPQQSDAASSPR
jgi:HEAT repeat protein